MLGLWVMDSSTVLLIDSDDDSIAIYSLILRHHGYAVLMAHDPEAGLRMAFENRPQLVIAEVFLPSRGGMQLIDRIREDQRTAEIPVIILDSMPSFWEELPDSAGRLRRLTKPCEPSRLLAEVRRLLDPAVRMDQ
ncbi:MAG: response regulator [Gemmatimonadota bacterium]